MALSNMWRCSPQKVRACDWWHPSAISLGAQTNRIGQSREDDRFWGGDIAPLV